jgi:hypothetical protein
VSQQALDHEREEVHVPTPTLGTTVKIALFAGIVSALLVAAFHFVVTEPVIERAIALEESHNQAMGMPEEEPVVSRDVQRFGLFVGFLIYGLTWAVLLGGIFYVVQRWLAGPLWARGVVLCGLGYWALAFLPFLKFPANPPGMGDPETITYRQGMYVGMLALNLVGVGFAVWLGRWRGWLIGLLALAIYSVLVFRFLPYTPDPVNAPGDVLAAFQIRALFGLTAFWTLVAVIFGLLLHGWERRVRARSIEIKATESHTGDPRHSSRVI